MQTIKQTTIVLLFATILMFGTFMAPIPARGATDLPREETLIIGSSTAIDDTDNANNIAALFSQLPLPGHAAARAVMVVRDMRNGDPVFVLLNSFDFPEPWTKMTMHLKDDAYWSDGVKMSAEDIEFSIVRIYHDIYPDQRYKGVETVEIVNPTTVVLHLSEADPRFPEKVMDFSIVWPHHLFDGLDTKESIMEKKIWPPVVAGPYEILDITQERSIWERQDTWWGEKYWGMPAAKYIIIRYGMSYDSMLLAIAKGEIDMMTPTTLKTLTDFEFLKIQNPDLILYAEEEPYPYIINLDISKDPWSRKTMRKAISLATNRDQMANILGVGAENTGTFRLPVLGSAGAEAYHKMLEPIMKDFSIYDPDRAEQIFIDEGFTKVDGTWTWPDGTPLSMEVWYVTGWLPSFEVYSKVFGEQMRTFGIDVSVKPTSIGVFVIDLFVGKYDAASFSVYLKRDPVDVFEWYLPENVKADCRVDTSIDCIRDRNWYRYAVSDEYAEKVRAVKLLPFDMNNPTAKQLYYDISEIFWDEMILGIPINTTPRFNVYSTTYWTGWSSVADPWEDALGYPLIENLKKAAPKAVVEEAVAVTETVATTVVRTTVSFETQVQTEIKTVAGQVTTQLVTQTQAVTQTVTATETKAVAGAATGVDTTTIVLTIIVAAIIVAAALTLARKRKD